MKKRMYLVLMLLLLTFVFPLSSVYATNFNILDIYNPLMSFGDQNLLYNNGSIQGIPQLGPNDVGIYQYGTGNSSVTPSFSSLTLILAIPNVTTFNNPGLTVSTYNANGNLVATGTGTYNGFKGSFSATSNNGTTKDIYGFLRLNTTNDGKSETFASWAQVEQYVMNVDASSFGIFEYTLNLGNNSLHGTGSTVDVTFNGAGLPSDTMVAAYGLGRVTSGTDEFFSPLVDTGIVPEPATIFLLGAGLAGLGLFARRKAKA